MAAAVTAAAVVAEAAAVVTVAAAVVAVAAAAVGGADEWARFPTVGRAGRWQAARLRKSAMRAWVRLMACMSGVFSGRLSGASCRTARWTWSSHGL